MTTSSDPQTAREGGVRTIEDLRGPAGRLEALLNPSRLPDPPLATVLLCHPHPLFGGTLHNKVVYHAMKVFTELGLPVLRFNFRGVNRSEGTHDNGRGEQDDARAGLDWLERNYGLPVVCAGFSFGAHMALRVGAADSRVSSLVSLGTPIHVQDRSYSYEFLANCEKPKLFMSGSSDEFSPLPKVEAVVETLPEPKQLVWIAGADHFFAGHLESMQFSLRGWLQAHVVPLQNPHAHRNEAGA